MRLDGMEDGWPGLVSGLRSLLKWSDGDVAEAFCRTYEYVVETAAGKVHVDMLSAKRDECRHCRLSCKRLRGRHAGGHHNSALPAPSLAKRANEEDCKDTPKSTAEECPSACMVTNQNREQYVKDYIFWLLYGSLSREFDALRQGFSACTSSQGLSLFSAEDFKLLVEGHEDVRAEKLQHMAQYDGGYTESHETIQDFWDIVKDFSPAQVRSLLEFVTASDRLPAMGTDGLIFKIQRNGEGDERLPTSSTCYGRLLLPQYTKRAVLKEKLCLAIENSQGFGVA
ncbi:MAG: hypothetical protein Q9169_000758 [Polycauliona sp. 2 TL-2023]